MALYKDEIYVAWDNQAGNIINTLYDAFSVNDTKSNKLDVHIFLHQNKLRDQRMVEWPENFIFHFTSTPSPNALQTALIAYVLENFERISRDLELEEVADKSRVFFIQESATQFEELKSMLYRIPHIKSSFNFKLLFLTEDLNADMLFTVSSNKRRTADSGRNSDLSSHTFSLNEVSSPRTIRHGRRVSDYATTDTAMSSPRMKNNRLSLKDTNSVINQCKHCERRRGSSPKFDAMDKKFFCMACFLEGKTSFGNDLCKNCQRSKTITMEDKSTTASSHDFSYNVSVQCQLPEHDYKDQGTSMTSSLTANVASQTDISLAKELSDELQAKLDALMLEIEEEYRAGPPVVVLPELHVPMSDDPFRLVDAQKNPDTNKFDCPFCEGKSFAKVSIFEVHLRNVHKKCNCSCERYFPSREDYLEHFYSVFPLPCFEQRKCPERFRSVPYQAIHHAKVHFAEKPYCCVICFDSFQNQKKGRFKDIRGLKMHAQEMEHDEEDLFLRVKNTEENSQVPLTGRASAINFSGDF